MLGAIVILIVVVGCNCLTEAPLEPLSAWCINDFIASTYKEVEHVIKLPLTKGGEFSWRICRPDKLIQFLAEGSQQYQQALSCAFDAAAGQRLGAIYYLDEVTPGNVLRPDNKRKFWAFYLGFQQCGAAVLCREQFWAPVAVLRTDVAYKIKGGISACFRHLLRCTVLDPCNLADIGCPVTIHGAPQLLRVTLAHLLADESALKSVLGIKGASGLLVCAMCRNVTSMHSDLTDGQDYIVDASCHDFTKFDPCTDDDFWTCFDRLAREKTLLGKGAFEKLERAMGIAYDEYSVVADLELRRFFRPITSCTMDWLHNFLCNGIVSIEIATFLQKAKAELNISYSQLDQYVNARWLYSSTQSRHKIGHVFSAHRDKNSTDTFRGSGSETLMVLPLLRHFTISIIVPTGKLSLASQSLLKLCDLVDMLSSTKKGDRPDVDMLAAWQDFLVLHKRAYGVDVIKPKHHYSYHNVVRAVQDEVFLDCFVHERKHQGLKRAGTTVKNTSEFEASVLGRVLLDHIRMLKTDVLKDGFTATSRPDPGISRALGANACVAKSLTFQSQRIGVGDIVFFHRRAGICMETPTTITSHSMAE